MKKEKTDMKRERKTIASLQMMMKLHWLFPEEICVMPLCGRKTGVLKKTPTKERINFIRGIGQLCEKCANETEIE